MYGLFFLLPFGVINAPFTFYKSTSNVYHDRIDKFLLLYLDDILVYSEDANILEHYLI